MKKEKNNKLDEREFCKEGIFQANMGSCQCGDVYTPFVVDFSAKIIYTPKGQHESWMYGQVDKRRYVVPYAGSIDLPEEGFKVKTVRVEGYGGLNNLKQTLVKRRKEDD